MIKRYFAVLLLLSLSSCDQYVHVQGHVIDTQTGKSLAGVKFRNKESTYKDLFRLTDSTGYFEYNELRSGGIGAGNKVTLIFLKDSFKTKTIECYIGDSAVMVKMYRK